jgi:hypothetical protein
VKNEVFIHYNNDFAQYHFPVTDIVVVVVVAADAAIDAVVVGIYLNVIL